jgi:hypothetical protein
MFRTHIYWKAVEDGEPASYEWGFPDINATDGHAGGIKAFHNADTSEPIDVLQNYSGSMYSSPYVFFPPVTPALDNEAISYFVAVDGTYPDLD